MNKPNEILAEKMLHAVLDVIYSDLEVNVICDPKGAVSLNLPNCADDLRFVAQLKSDPYAELKAAHAAGKTVEVLSDDGVWRSYANFNWDSPVEAYRIKPEGDWREHDGGPCPVDANTPIRYRMRDGAERETDEPQMLYWKHNSDFGTDEITAWRPAAPPAKWQREKLAYANGAKIEGRCPTSTVASVHEWQVVIPRWFSDWEYRIAPEAPAPQSRRVPLTAAQVPPGSVFRAAYWPETNFIAVSQLTDTRVFLSDDTKGKTFAELKEEGFYIRRPGEDWMECCTREAAPEAS